MKPITVSTSVSLPRDDVYDFLAPLMNHEPFTDHMLVDWSSPNPEEAGVGGRVRMRSNTPGPANWIDMEVVAAERPTRLRERSVGANGARVSHGTYTLADRPGGGTDITFEFVLDQAPLHERLLNPFTRRWLQRGNDRAMVRLKALLEGEPRALAA